MTDELKPLKAIFDAEPDIKASDHARKKAMAAAMQAFENHHQTDSAIEDEKANTKENKINNQGNSIQPRQKGKDSNDAGFFTFLYWRELMKLSYVIPTVAAGALAISVLVFNPQLLNSRPSDNLSVQTIQDVNPISHQQKERSEKRNNESMLRDQDVASLQKDKLSEPAIKDQPQEEKQRVKSKKEQFSSSIDREDDSAKTIVGSNQEGAANVSVIPARQNIEEIVASQQTRGQQNKNIAFPKTLPSAPMVVAEKEITQQTSPSSLGNDKFQTIKTNPLKLTHKDPVSTFSIDVDTASYSFMRAAINQNTLPQKDAVRIEELINYFPYDYPQPSDSEQPFKVSTTIMPTPWNTNTKLLHIGIKGYQLPKEKQPNSNLVFLLDTSGSMNQANKLPLLKKSFKLLLSTLQPTDTVSIVAYAGSAGTVLAPTKVAEKATIIQALERLNAGGSTAGGQGIRLAYQLAEANYDKQAVNRVILATDGDFNVGINNQEELKSFIERKRQSGVFLSVLGFGMGNYNDALMQTLAQNGNGNAAYIDSLSEARKVLVEEASSTLFTIAKDVKIQMEFNPKAISQYRLIGYETRQLKREDFNNDNVDAGDIGAGHTVTAIYEITPIGAENNAVDPLRYGDKKTKEVDTKHAEYGFLKLRYKQPDQDKSQLIETPIRIADIAKSIDNVSNETRFATAVAAFGQLLRGGTYTNTYSYDDVIALAQTAKGADLFGYRAEFITLVRLAKSAEALR